MAVLDKGEYTIHPAYEKIKISANQWTKMTYDQQQAALQKIHTCSVEDGSRTKVSTLMAAVSAAQNPILK